MFLDFRRSHLARIKILRGLYEAAGDTQTSVLNVIRRQKHNKHHYEQYIWNTVQQSRAQRAGRTYLIRDENRDGQRSKQKTAFVSWRLRDRDGQTEKEKDPSAADGQQTKKDTETGLVSRTSSMQLDGQRSLELGPASRPVIRPGGGWKVAARWHILGVVVKCLTWSLQWKV